jgi:hypothetical protein
MLLASASAFAPLPTPSFAAQSQTALFMSTLQYGKYDEKLWDMDAKLDVYGAWNPSAPRSPANFNPFETFEGNSPDASGFYPGEGRYKDPKRGDVNYMQMMKERTILEQIAANPKAPKGCPGCRT